MHARELLAKVRQGAIPNVVLIVGAESFFMSRAVSALRAAVLADGFSGLNEDVLEGRSSTATRVLETARTLPMLASKRFVLVREISGMPAAELDRRWSMPRRSSRASCARS
jgi:DNA polymerase III delta subunit